MAVELTENVTQGLAEIGEAAAKAGVHSVEVLLPKGMNVTALANAVVVIVFARNHGFAYAKQVPEGAPKARELGLWIASAEQAISELSKRSVEAPSLTAAEAALLDDVAFTEGDQSRPGAFERSRITFDILMQRESWSLAEAATRLRVSPSRLRQRLSATSRTLYGVKDGRSWRIPKFQFARSRQVRGISDVIPHIRPEAHPLAVRNWFTTPHQDLVVGDEERPISPLEWLSSGRPSSVVASLGEEI